MEDKQTSKKRASFLPNRLNRYSIRKFTVGTASILVGASLFFGASTQDAKAAEETTAATTNSTTPDKDTSVEPTKADAATSETASKANTAVEQSTAATQAEAAKAEPAKTTQTSEKGDTVKAEQPASVEQQKQATQNTTDAVKTAEVKAAQSTETQSKPAEKVKETVQPVKIDETVQATPVLQAIELEQVVDAKTATQFYAQSAGVSNEQATEIIKGLNLPENATPEEIREAIIYQLTHEYESNQPIGVLTNTKPKVERVLNDQRYAKYGALIPPTLEIIDADAFNNGYINSGSDETVKPNVISGRAWMTDEGTSATGTNSLTPVPANTPVYMQWQDKDGSVSPIYRAYTHNRNNLDSAQDGPGAYAFDLRHGWTDATGKNHLYKAVEGQKYHFWIYDFKTKDGNTATMLRQAGGFYPGAFVNSVTGNNLGQFPSIGTNMQRTGIFMSVIPTNHYMVKAKSQWTQSQGRISDDPSVLAIDGMNTIRGRVWQETGAGDQATSATGPNYNPFLGDKAASGYKVVMSSLTTEGARAYDAQVKGLQKSQRPAAAKRLLTAHPEYISQTVVATTNSEGSYTAQFDAGKLNMDHVYGYVLDPKGNLVQTYSGFTSPEYRPPNFNNSFAPSTLPSPGIQQWASVNFAVVESPTFLPILDINNFNTTTQPATPGSKATIKLLDGKIPSLDTHIEWISEGKVVHKTSPFKTVAQGEKLGAFTIPSNAKDGQIYTALLVVGGNAISGDSLIVHTTNSNKYPPKATGITKPFGEAATQDEVKKHVTIPHFPTGGKQPVITIDDPSLIPDGQTPGTVQVPVTVTYPDKSVAKINVPVTTGNQADKDKYTPTADAITKPFGQATNEAEVKSKVHVPNFPTGGTQPTYTVDTSKIPDGHTPGTVNVPVTVTYPDGSSEVVNVPVTTGNQPDKDKYTPTAGSITKPFGQAATPEEVKGKVSVPNFPKTGAQPTLTVDTTKIPNGQTPGTVKVPVTVTYPDKTSEVVNVPVTTGNQPDKDKYQPTTGSITKPFGQAATPEEVKGKVSVPHFPTSGTQPTYTVDTSKIPNGQTPGTVNVPVTVTYPDKTSEVVNVPVTTGNQPDKDKYQPATGEITKPFGIPTSEAEVKGKVSVPNFPAGGTQPTYTVDTSKLPNGQTS
ncbi:Rib/alpha-like domain-containing protein, partial [Staphylococcus sp. EZ-P03]|uniref:Rib/alpha-like domain-containing protein n=1 Tax=Staphylococcus sp. EZ-P03 TaxID=2282739 RepID=UPI000DF82822